MHSGVVLDVDFIAKGDTVYIPAHDASEPKTTTIATFELANNGCVIRCKTIGAEFGRMS
jgi:hypothetical protein